MKPHLGVAGLALMAATLVACGGGGSVSAPPPAPSSSPSFAFTTATLSTTGTTPVKLSYNGTAATVTLPAVNAKANANVYLQTELGGVPAPQARTMSAKSRIPNAIGGSNLTALAYVLVTVDTSVSMTSSPAFSFTLGSPISGPAYIAVLDLKNASAGWNVFLGPATISGSTVSFAAQTIAPPLALQANDTYAFALVTTSSALPTPTPSIAPNTALYSGTKSVNYQYGFGYSYPPTGATAPPTTLNYNVSTTVNVGSSPFPGTTTAKVVDEHVAESDASNLSSSTFTTDSWVSIASAGSGFNAALYGQIQQEPSSANLPVTKTIYGTPQIIDEFPETTGAKWSNSPAAAVAYSYADGNSGTRTINADGTYSDTEQMGPADAGETVNMQMNADGSGQIVGPIEGGFLTEIDVSAPSPVPSATPVITITEHVGQFYQQNYGYPATLTKSDKLWYIETSQYYNEADSVTTGVTLPSGCTPNPYGSTANEVVRKVSNLDTLIGYLDSTEFDTYTVNGFPVCMVTTDDLQFAYGQQGVTPSIFAVGPLGLETVLTNETLIIQNTPPSSSAQALHTQAAARATSLVAALQAHQLNAFQRERVLRKQAFLKKINGGQQ